MRRLQWVELTPDYRCNNRCLGCFAVQDDGPSMTDGEIVSALQRGRSDGADCLWLGGGEPTLRKDLFRIAAAAHADEGPGFMVSLHTPACVLPAALHGALFDAAAFGMRVVNPGGHAFDLAESPMEGGFFLPTCEGCRYRSRCNGLRRDYLAVHGAAEFRPVA
jgi:MoaA/NifB/PqqE/SkfB family radical SAM enzyme